MNDFFNFLIAVGTFSLFCGIVFVNNERKIFREVSILCAVISIICFTAVYCAPQINSYFLDKHTQPITHIVGKVKKSLELRK